MKKTYALLLAIVALMVGMNSCKYKSDYQLPQNANVYDNSKTVTASLYGVITDISGSIVSDATVSIENYITKTDSNGLFQLTNVTIPQHNACVKVTKEGHFVGYRSIRVQQGARHEVRLRLIKHSVPQTYIATTATELNFASSLQLSFPANAVINKATGIPYTGQVYVYAHRIDPTGEVGRSIMPGDLRGLSTLGTEAMLMSYGMLAVELFDASGSELVIAPNKEVKIQYEVPSSLVASAPSQIAMWHFDEQKGIWVEEGSASLSGNKYLGNVKHFSFWNFDIVGNNTSLNVNFVDGNNIPLQGYTVKITNSQNSDWSTSITNSNGWVGGYIYSNATLTLEVYNNAVCGTIPVYSQTLNTNNSPINLGTITINMSSANTSIFSGQVVDCNNNVVPYALVLIQPYNYVIHADANGGFYATIPCTINGTVNVSTYNPNSYEHGSINTTLSTGMNMLGTLYACGNTTPYLDITLTNTVTSMSANKVFLAPTDLIEASIDSVGMSYSSITAMGSGSGVYIQTNDSTSATHPVINAIITNLGGFTDTQFTLAPGGTITYSSFPLFPDQVLGNFSFTMIGFPSGNTYTLSGSFRAPRNN